MITTTYYDPDPDDYNIATITTTYDDPDPDAMPLRARAQLL